MSRTSRPPASRRSNGPPSSRRDVRNALGKAADILGNVKRLRAEKMVCITIKGSGPMRSLSSTKLVQLTSPGIGLGLGLDRMGKMVETLLAQDVAFKQELKIPLAHLIAFRTALKEDFREHASSIMAFYSIISMASKSVHNVLVDVGGGSEDIREVAGKKDRAVDVYFAVRDVAGGNLGEAQQLFETWLGIEGRGDINVHLSAVLETAKLLKPASS